MDTLELLPSLAQGELSETSAPELVAAVFRSRASGTLWFEAPDGAEIRVFFRAGEMCGASAFPGVQTLAHVLLANDWVDALAIESSRDEAVKSGKRHGEVLVARGLLKKDQLRSALATQHTTNLLTLLGMTQGKYDWRGWEPPPAWAREVVVDPVSCLVDALEQDQHEPRRAKVLSWLGAHPVRFSMDWPDLETRITLGDADRKATALLSLPRQLAEFVRASQLEPGRAEAVLVALLLAGAVEPQPGVKPQPVAAPSAPPPAARQPAPKAAAPAKAAAAKPASPPAAPPQPAAARDGDFDLQPAPPSRQKRMEEREAIARLDALSLDDDAPPPQQQEEEELELDRPAAAQASPVAEHGEDERARELRKKMLARGLRNLGGLTREERENSVAVTPKHPAPASRGAAAQREGEMSPDEQRYADDVRSRVRLAPGQNAYARLGVDATASSEKIRNAYLEAAKLFHPDRAAGPALSALQPELQTLFALLKEAYEEIATPDARKKYEAALKHRSPEGVRKEEAGIALKMGEVLLKKRDFGEALIKLRRSVELDPTGDALAALAWGLVADPKSSAAVKEEAAGLINKALRAPGVTARTYYVAGVLWRTKDPESAIDAFRKALEMDPKHQDAALEIRLIEQRRNKPAAQKSGGVLSGLLFGKRKS